jgi:hypothetical protein
MKKKQPKRERAMFVGEREMERVIGGRGFVDSGPSDSNRILERHEGA